MSLNSWRYGATSGLTPHSIIVKRLGLHDMRPKRKSTLFTSNVYFIRKTVEVDAIEARTVAHDEDSFTSETIFDKCQRFLMIRAEWGSLQRSLDVNAPLTPTGRRILCERISGGRPIAHVAGAEHRGQNSMKRVRSGRPDRRLEICPRSQVDGSRAICQARHRPVPAGLG